MYHRLHSFQSEKNSRNYAVSLSYRLYEKVSQWGYLLPLFLTLGYIIFAPPRATIFGNTVVGVPGSDMLAFQEAGDQVRQIFLSLGFMLASIGVFRRHEAVTRSLYFQKTLLLLIAFAFLSIIWSGTPVMSAKRCIQFLGIALVGWSAMQAAGSYARLISVLRTLFTVSLFVSLVFVALIPGRGIEADTGAWVGIFAHKNTFGLISLIVITLWLPVVSTRHRAAYWMLGLLVMSFAFLTVYMSDSRSSQIAIVVVLSLWFAMKLPFRWPLKITLLPIPALILLFWVLNFQALGFEEYFSSAVSRDVTLTGRTFLWEAVWDNFLKHPILGAGYNGFWTSSNEATVQIVASLGWTPLQSHNGYLDILNEIGLVGAGLFGFLLFQTLRNSALLYRREKVLGMTFFLLIISQVTFNFAETSFGRGTSPGWFILILCYIALTEFRVLEKENENNAKRINISPPRRKNIAAPGEGA